MGNLNEEEYNRYQYLSMLIIIFFFILVVVMGVFLFTAVYNFYYYYIHDELTAMQVFKMFISKYLVLFIAYLVDSWLLKSTYRSWNVLNKKKEGLG